MTNPNYEDYLKQEKLLGEMDIDVLINYVLEKHLKKVKEAIREAYP